MESMKPTWLVQDDSFIDESKSTVMRANENDSKGIFLVTNFLKFQDETSNSESSYLHDSSSSISEEKIENIKINYEKTCFMIEIMLIDENEEKKATRDFLISYFHEFPQYDYCLVNLSTMVTPPEFKKTFCKVFLKPNQYKSIGQLYALHRLSLFGNITSAVVTKENLEIAEDLIINHPFEKILLDNISKSVFEDTRYKTYILQCDDQPIGYCVIRLCDEITFLNSHFDVARYVYPELARNHSGVLLNMDIQAKFLNKTRCLLKSIMDDNDINCLFYKLYSDSIIMEQNESSYISGINELIPVKPRTRIQYDDDDLSGNNLEKFALFHMNTRLCTTQKLSLDVKIVVVGASTVALSFLERLLFNPLNHYLSFENIVLVSEHGMPYRVGLTDLEDCMVPKVTHYNHEYMKTIALNSFVNVVTGTVTEISRSEKHVTVKEHGTNIYYDYLFLFNGEQFTHNIENIKTLPEKRKKNNPSHNSSMFRSAHFSSITLAIIVYGKYLGSLSVINVLLESNIDGRRIVYVEPGDRVNLPFIDNATIKRAVYDELYSRGVSVHEGLQFETLTLTDDQMKIQNVSFSSNVKSITIDCAGLFWFDQKSVNKNNWNLLYAFEFDGHLVINRSFETNVDCVYAAGPVARYDGPERDARRCDSSEIGGRVADVLMKRLRARHDDDDDDGTGRRPLSVRCRLPGGHRYLRCTEPGTSRPRTVLHTVKTGDAATGYFEIEMDGGGRVTGVSCYSKADFKYSNLINLCGKNVNLFNDMMNRLRTDSIPCFFDFFNEPWAYPLYSDRFPKILNDVIKLREANPNNKVRNKIMSTYTEELEKVLITFVDENVDDFPEFAHVRDAVDLANSGQHHY
ncbi:cilia- and flagella-associated protein 61-like [Sipha flava]|uniref:Cilia- and flagella-associated protein 61-like n=1 Tax=Sipha flava TaxID=143950 RepID=A0A8B8G9V7_9HEMI|nr:cilia- and flagella-associated protein 61-like [Sipha flava]